jgi:hypothetical protein
MTPLPAEPVSDRRRLLLIPLAALVAVHPLLVHGCSCGHDFDFHLLNWMEVAKQFSQGNLHPHWAYSAAYNAGEPRFVFYPPLSWVLGAVLGLLLTHLPGVTQAAGWNAAPIVFTWVALTLSGMTLYRLARAFANANAALLAAVLYVANPYMLFTSYERTAYAELIAAAWIPLLLLSILQEEVTVSGVAIPIALLWLTNAPAAVMGCYTLAVLAAIRIATNLGAPRLASETWVSRRHFDLGLALKTLAGTALGLALAAFYIVPAAYERRFVQVAMATIGGMQIDQNFLFEHTGTSSDALLHDQVLHTASSIALILLATAIVALVVVFLLRRRSAVPTNADVRELRFPLIPLAILTSGIALLLTSLSAPIWNHAPEVAFLQFPWRLLAILAPIGALAVAAALGRIPLTFTKTAVAGIVIATALTVPAYHHFRQRCYPEDTAPAQLASFQLHAGSGPTDEYTPTAADNDALKPNDPAFWIALDPSSGAPATSQPGAAPMHLSITAPQPEFLILNLREYPAWRIYRNGALDADYDQRDDGLIAIAIPAGASNVEIRYASTPDQKLGDGITFLALLVLLWLLSVRRGGLAPRQD